MLQIFAVMWEHVAEKWWWGWVWWWSSRTITANLTMIKQIVFIFQWLVQNRMMLDQVLFSKHNEITTILDFSSLGCCSLLLRNILEIRGIDLDCTTYRNHGDGFRTKTDRNIFALKSQWMNNFKKIDFNFNSLKFIFWLHNCTFYLVSSQGFYIIKKLISIEYCWIKPDLQQMIH